jgi:hypothetical protein
VGIGRCRCPLVDVGASQVELFDRLDEKMHQMIARYSAGQQNADPGAVASGCLDPPSRNEATYFFDARSTPEFKGQSPKSDSLPTVA